MRAGLRWPALTGLGESVRAGRASTSAWVARSRERIAALDGGINAMVPGTVALAEAAAGDGATDAPPADLPGVPLAVKDNIAVRGLPLTCGSRALEGFVPSYEATVVERLRRSGAVVVGKTNLDEFGMGSSTETSVYGPTRNPWDPSRVAGGSSGGSAAAVAAAMVPAAIGTDTGGSVRQPAAFCGVVGFKPSYGTVSRHGLVAYGSSLDQAGFLATRVGDVAELFRLSRGPDGLDDTVRAPREPAAPAALRVGLARSYLEEPRLDRTARQALTAAADALRDEGVEVVVLDLPFLDDRVIAAYYVTACAEASSNLARFDGIRYGRRAGAPAYDVGSLVTGSRELLGEEVTLRLLLGTFVLRSGHYERYYGRAQAVRASITAGFAGVFGRVDAVLGPTVTGPAFQVGQYADDALTMKLGDMFTVPANLAGLPAVALPAGVEAGLPTSVQLTGARFGDAALLQAAAALERRLRFDPATCPAAMAGPSAGGFEV